jgi:hypothetical protein
MFYPSEIARLGSTKFLSGLGYNITSKNQADKKLKDIEKFTIDFLRQRNESSDDFDMNVLLDALQEKYPPIKVKVTTIGELDDSNQKAKQTKWLHEHVNAVVTKSEKSQGKRLQEEPKGGQGRGAGASLPGIEGLLQGARPMK